MFSFIHGKQLFFLYGAFSSSTSILLLEKRSLISVSVCYSSVTECSVVALQLRLGGALSLWLAGGVGVLGRPLAEGEVGPPFVLIEAVPLALHRTCAVHPVALALSLGTLAVVAVAPPPVTGQPVDREHVLGTGVALAVAVLRQVALVLLRATLLAARRHLAHRRQRGNLSVTAVHQWHSWLCFIWPVT